MTRELASVNLKPSHVRMQLRIEAEPNPGEEEALDGVGVVLRVVLKLIAVLIEFFEQRKNLSLAQIFENFYSFRINL